MALIKCKECGNDVSEQAVSCPHCGAPMKPAVTSPLSERGKELKTAVINPDVPKYYKKQSTLSIVEIVLVVVFVVLSLIAGGTLLLFVRSSGFILFIAIIFIGIGIFQQLINRSRNEQVRITAYENRLCGVTTSLPIAGNIVNFDIVYTDIVTLSTSKIPLFTKRVTSINLSVKNEISDTPKTYFMVITDSEEMYNLIQERMRHFGNNIS